MRRAELSATYVILDGAGIQTERLSATAGDRKYEPIPDYPAARAAVRLLELSQAIGASVDALTELGSLIEVSDKSKAKALANLSSNKARSTTTKTIRTAKGDVETVVKRKPRNSAASMFKSLIMAGDLTDDEIFAKVAEAFNLDQSKRSYVSVYRSTLKREGQNPPAPKGTKKLREGRDLTSMVAKKSKKTTTKQKPRKVVFRVKRK
jgi:hypothetical protein